MQAGKLDKRIITQYADLREEVKELREKIIRLEDQISLIEKEGSVKDCVKGGDGGIQHYKVEGFPIPEYNKKANLLKKTKLQLEIKELELLEIYNETEKFIYSIPDSHIRRIINLRLIEDMTWQQVANRLGGGNTEIGVKQAFYRYMNKL